MAQRLTAQVVIGNTGTAAINGWSLTFTLPGDQKVTSNFNGGFSQTGENVTLTNASYNGAIARVQRHRQLQGHGPPATPLPASFTLNGVTCTS